MPRRGRRFILICVPLALAGLALWAWSSRAAQQPTQLGPGRRPFRRVDFTSAQARRLMRLVADHYAAVDVPYPPLHGRRHPGLLANNWQLATFYIGVMAAGRATEDPHYVDLALDWARSCAFRPLVYDRQRVNGNHADGQACGAVFLQLYQLHRDPAMLDPIRDTFDLQLRADPVGRELWWWADALFMAPPVMARLARVTGRYDYLRQADRMWWDVASHLYDPGQGLWSRDARYLIPPPKGPVRRSPNGSKVFWARGNGWVFAGLARLLEQMPETWPSRRRFEQLFVTMARRIVSLQGPDGLWRPDLLDPEAYRTGESSASGLFCYGLAWGMGRGLLDRDEFLPPVRRAWAGLVGLVDRRGRLWQCQPEARAPGMASTSRAYGAGAFLLAASEVLDLLD